MNAGEILAVVAATLLAVLAGVLVAALYQVGRTLRELGEALDDFVADTEELVAELSETARHAGAQVDRVDRLVTAAEGIEGRVQGASRLAQRTFTSPVVKAMALGAGVSRASERLRTGTDLSRRKRRRRRAS